MPPNLPPNQVVSTSQSLIASAAGAASQGGKLSCQNPTFAPVGRIAQVLGSNGNWHYDKNWVGAGQVAEGLHLDPSMVRLADMNGDGRADYLWVNPDSGQLTCWLNNLPGAWSPAGSNGPPLVGAIADSAGAGN